MSESGEENTIKGRSSKHYIHIFPQENREKMIKQVEGIILYRQNPWIHGMANTSSTYDDASGGGNFGKTTGRNREKPRSVIF